jgi:hypothetical protein
MYPKHSNKKGSGMQKTYSTKYDEMRKGTHKILRRKQNILRWNTQVFFKRKIILSQKVLVEALRYYSFQSVLFRI